MPRGPFRLRLSGGARTAARIRAIGPAGEVAAIKILQQGGERLAGRARRRVAADLNALRGSIIVRPVRRRGTQIVVEVGTNKVHGPFIEFGTGPAGGRSTFDEAARAVMAELGYAHGPRGGWPPLDVITAWARRKGFADPEAAAFFIQRRIRTRGTPARPFLVPSWRETMPEVEAELTALVRSLGKRRGRQ